MERGLINLTAAELKQVLQAVSQHPQAKHLLPKLQTAIQQNQATSDIQVSAEELEVLLDNLPTPQEQEDQLVANLRTKTQQALTQLRVSNQTAANQSTPQL
ncbi:MAG: hypothetical protein GF390_03905 [Candidatus Pacebacteria bacterium]|nr:hypothetical protein [Candidatus Paceibacterota bacterium]